LKPWIAVDFDHTIRDVKHGEYDRPMEGVGEALAELQKTFRVLVHSCNSPQFIEKWLNEFGIPVDAIWQIAKPVASYYIDDRAIKFTSWKQVLEEING